jgi:hypothetical protein
MNDSPHFYLNKLQFLERDAEHSSPPKAEDENE